MPLYSFQCQVCGKEFDEFYRIQDCPDVRNCENQECGGLAHKVLAARGVVFSDTPSYLEDPMLQGALQDIDCRHFRPIESRSGLKRFMKQNGICEAPKAGPRWI